MRQLMEELKNGTLKGIYLLFGEERYLVRLYEGRIRRKVMDPAAEPMNMTVFEGKDVDLSDVENALNTMPFMCERRLVALRGTGLFAAGSKEGSERCARLVENAPPTALLLFVETEVDKRLKLFKQVVKTGRAIEFKRPDDGELADWVRRGFQGGGKRVSAADAAHLLRVAPDDMDAVEREIDKLIAYVGEREDVTRADIDIVCTKSLESSIFAMVDAIGNKQPDRALDIFNNLLVLKESPIKVIAMISRQFRIILQSKLWAGRGLSAADIAGRIGQRGFVVSGCLKQGRHFTTEELTRALKDCLDTDLTIKTGRMSDKLAVEMLILEHSRQP